MTGIDKEQYLKNILLQLDASRLPTRANALLLGVEKGGFDSNLEELKREISYLVSKGYVIEERSKVSAGLIYYKITDLGIDYLEAI